VVGNGVVLHAVTDENGGDNAVTLELAQYRALAAAHSALLDTTQVCKRPLS